MENMQEILAKLSAHNCVMALNKLGDDELNVAFDPLIKISEMSMKEHLDLFKAELGEEHYKLLCVNPTFNDMLKDFIGRRIMAASREVFDLVYKLCEKYKVDPPTQEEFNALLWVKSNEANNYKMVGR
jgi:hypothetical protein